MMSIGDFANKFAAPRSAATGGAESLQSTIGSRKAANRAILIGIHVAAAAIYLYAYMRHPARPRSPQDLGWIGYFDQGFYHKAAYAWSHWNLDPNQHWYLPGYPLLAAPFARWLPYDVFLIPDLTALLLSLYLFGRLAAVLAPEIPAVRLVASLIFVGSSVLMPAMREVWVVPISTTATTPLVYGGLLAAVAFIDSRNRVRMAFVAALLFCAIPSFRPSDAFAPILASSVGMLFALIRRYDGPAATSAVVAGAVAGALAALVPLAVIYYCLYGLQASGYVAISSALGFEVRLLALRWVTLVLDPRPLLPDGKGLVEGFPWIVPGIAGFFAVLFTKMSLTRWIKNFIVVAAVVLNTCLYLCYRDLHPKGLFEFTNYHYFKWALPILAFYAFWFVWTIVLGPRRIATAAIGLTPLLVLLPWRVQLKPLKVAQPPTVIGDVLSFTENLSDLHNVLLIGVAGDPGRLYGGGHSLTIGGRTWGFVDVRTYPEPGGVILVPLRPLGSGQAQLKFEPSTGTFRTDIPPILARQTFVFGLPCFLWPQSRSVCHPTKLLPPPELPRSGALLFDGADAGYLNGGWSIVQDGSRWTEGDTPSLRFRLAADLIGSPFQIEFDARPFIPEHAPPLTVGMEINGTPVADWHFFTGDASVSAATIAPKLVPRSGDVDLTFRMQTSRRPMDFYADSKDARALGLLLHSLRIRRTP